MRLRILHSVCCVLLFASSAWTQVPDRRAVLQEERARFGPMLDQAQAGEVLARTAWRLRTEGFGFLLKSSGNRCPVPNGGAVTISCDWLVHQPSGLGCDVLGSGPGPEGPGPSTPHWCSRWEPFDQAKFLAPIDPGGTPPDPSDDPPPGEGLIERLDAMAAQLAAIEGRIAELSAAVTVLASRPWPTYHTRSWLLGGQDIVPKERPK